jgi:hypothetical protein
VALLIDLADEGFGFLRWSGVDMAQEAIQREGTGSDQIGEGFNGLWYTIHVSHHSSAARTGAALDARGGQSLKSRRQTCPSCRTARPNSAVAPWIASPAFSNTQGYAAVPFAERQNLENIQAPPVLRTMIPIIKILYNRK